MQADEPTVGLLTAILDVAPDYPKDYFLPWFKHAHRRVQGIPDSRAGSGTKYLLGFLDAAKEMGYDINVVIQSTQNWRPNKKRENAINEWLTQNTNKSMEPIKSSRHLLELAQTLLDTFIVLQPHLN